MAGERADGPADVVTMLPPRRRPSIRRTTSHQTVPAPSWDRGAVVEATARDQRVDQAGSVQVVDTDRMTVELDTDSTIRAVQAALPASLTDRLVGLSVARGFRAALGRFQADGALDLGSLPAALLDDLPTVRMVNGYARMMEMPESLPTGRSPALDVCVGWQREGTASHRSLLGVPLLNAPPVAPPLPSMLDIPEDFHTEAPQVPGSMLRRRVLEVSRAHDGGVHDGGVEVFEYFRDSYVNPAGHEGALHEYVVRCTLSADDLIVRDIHVEPRTLPFPDCPLASPHATALIGTPVRDADNAVRSRLRGVVSCTHLNDVLRFLRFVPELTAGLDADRDAA